MLLSFQGNRGTARKSKLEKKCPKEIYIGLNLGILLKAQRVATIAEGIYKIGTKDKLGSMSIV